MLHAVRTLAAAIAVVYTVQLNVLRSVLIQLMMTHTPLKVSVVKNHTYNSSND
jgi:hypothetical protein